eukprot:TRINITY_DN1582_c0_g2_i9.p1 TRINITY_DN1582_c0_g2~~TRINITY_DN1582_c0_g2_i9.p1  ORF type:complete len:625 (+),score=100.20 TRINITY_DN1582_c0_g2_i9:602-2476(+)
MDPPIAPNSTADQVQQWFYSPGNEDFAEYSHLFVGLKGSRVLGFSKQDMVDIVENKAVGKALWNALHPDVMDVEKRDVQIEELKAIIAGQKQTLNCVYLANVDRIISSNVNNVKKDHIFSETIYSDNLPIHGILTEEEAEQQEMWMSLFLNQDTGRQDKVPRAEEVTTFYDELFIKLKALSLMPNADEDNDVHPIIDRILNFVKQKMASSMVVYAECRRSEYDFVVNTEKRPDFLIVDCWEPNFVDIFKRMIFSIEAKKKCKKKNEKSLRNAAYDCIRNLLFYLKKTEQLHFLEVQSMHLITDGINWYPIKLTIIREEEEVELHTTVEILCHIDIMTGEDALGLLLQLIITFLRREFVFKIEAAGEKDDVYPRFNPKNDPTRIFVTKEILQITRRSVISKVTEENTFQSYIIKSMSSEYEHSMLKELEISAKVSHPNILTPFLFDRDTKTNMLFSVSDIGERLGKEIRIPMQPILLNCLVSDMHEALNYLFDGGFLYLDLHPGNVVFLDGKFKLIDLEGITSKGTKWFSIGTLLFSSVGYMCGEVPTFESSYESLLYLYEFCKSGKLPWWNENDTVRIAEMKVQLLMDTAFEVLNEHIAYQILEGLRFVSERSRCINLVMKCEI